MPRARPARPLEIVEPLPEPSAEARLEEALRLLRNFAEGPLGLLGPGYLETDTIFAYRVVRQVKEFLRK